MRNLKYFILIIALLAGFASCKQNTRKRPDPNIPPKFVQEPKFKHQGELFFFNAEQDTIASFNMEVADTDAKREQGLMNRKTMKDNQSMLFIFNREERQVFWMKNTHIPLDIIFINNAMEVVHIAKHCKPYSLEGIHSYEYARYVVEVNSGLSDKLNINTNSTLAFTRN